MFPPIISTTELRELLGQNGVIVVDARAAAGHGEAFRETHLKGALPVDLDNELSNVKDPAHGGRHPLPDIKSFGAVLGAMGITPGSHVVVYDDKQGANAASRFWWMLKAVGHEKAQVLNGGLQAAVAAGLPMESGMHSPVPVKDYPVSGWLLPVVSIETVEERVKDKEWLVIDVRDPRRYSGETEPIDLIAGHIPGAVNIPLTDNLDSDGQFKSPQALAVLYGAALEGRPASQVIVHCGSGVTACHSILAMAAGGLEIPALYVGSWSEWSRTNRPVGTGNA
ncbi:sulfurtransferase [Flavihumibacter petaseus]|uniref:Putative 3-mercaptopyruvate sulfurtransferase n=1 Tax=Flavihumibacter petaseus NBRC 106054 TaxID=1220578 RepID=A0A0E9MTE3_9BACT|nr:sulfurtransferase [Flavihumibacter petaseus]GAO41027.1 putative 3-mercaptopyruvate sulfurtransferase [Flavihumibacter petaseus NBRC 106054]